MSLSENRNKFLFYTSQTSILKAICRSNGNMSALLFNRLNSLARSVGACRLFVRGNHSTFYTPPPDPIEPTKISNEDLEVQREKEFKDYKGQPEVEPVQDAEDTATRIKNVIKDTEKLVNFKQDFPDFLPTPISHRRDRVLEIVERKDMLRRRKVLDIPMFFVGSIVAVTVADKFGKESRFLGIVTQREDQGLKHKFTVRNVIDEQGIEVCYDMYCPLIQKIEVIRLEKRLDDNLRYLRDAPLEYSYFPQDMKKDLNPHKEGKDVPINPLKVKLNSHPWSQRYERLEPKGVQYPLTFRTERAEKKLMRKKEIPIIKKPWERVDIMKHYRESTNLTDVKEIMSKTKDNLTQIAKERHRKRLEEMEKVRQQQKGKSGGSA